MRFSDVGWDIGETESDDKCVERRLSHVSRMWIGLRPLGKASLVLAMSFIWFLEDSGIIPFFVGLRRLFCLGLQSLTGDRGADTTEDEMMGDLV